MHQTFYTLLNAITGVAGNIYPAYPYKDLRQASSKNSYPIFILESPDIDSWDRFTLKKLKVEGTITFEIYTTAADTCDEYTSDAFDKIETSVNSLRGDGLKWIDVAGMTKDVVQHEKINIHVKTIKWKYKFIFDRSSLPY